MLRKQPKLHRMHTMLVNGLVGCYALASCYQHNINGREREDADAIEMLDKGNTVDTSDLRVAYTDYEQIINQALLTVALIN